MIYLSIQFYVLLLSESVCPNEFINYDEYKPICEIIITYKNVIGFLNRICLENDSVTLEIIDTFKKITLCKYFGEYFNPYRKLFLENMTEEQKTKRKYYLHFVKLFNKLINSKQFVVKQNMLDILQKTLSQKHNLQIMLKYISSEENFNNVVSLFMEESNFPIEIYHILKYFIGNPVIPYNIKKIINRRSTEIIDKVLFMLPSTEDKQILSEMEFIIKKIKNVNSTTLHQPTHFVTTHSTNSEIIGICTKEELDEIQKKNVVTFLSFGSYDDAKYYYDDMIISNELSNELSNKISNELD